MCVCRLPIQIIHSYLFLVYDVCWLTFLLKSVTYVPNSFLNNGLLESTEPFEWAHVPSRPEIAPVRPVRPLNGVIKQRKGGSWPSLVVHLNEINSQCL